mmetsp:Transcript_16010/g.24828  ORF Transcript_16010/g.24828 Transcript_16010/m.24828 type:complete len:231 (-) Transcript_16010:25-717(-)
MLLDQIRDSWMKEEMILLLVQEKRYETAIEIYVKEREFAEAELFCVNKSSLGLMNTLLKIYFDRYKAFIEQRRQCTKEKNTQASLKAGEEAAVYKKQAMELMKRYSSSSMLDPHLVLEMIPEDWELKKDDLNLVSYLQSMFDRLLTVEENSRISSQMTNMEVLNKEKEANELKQAYLVIGDESMCKVCNRKLQYKFIKVFPNGGVYHSMCAKEQSECPVTKQRFNIETSH